MAVLFFTRSAAFSLDSIRVTAGHFRQFGTYLAICVLIAFVAIADTQAQRQEPASVVATFGSMQGQVRDAAGQPVANAVVSLHLAGGLAARDASALAAPIQVTHTDSRGAYRFPAVEPRDYILSTNIAGYIPSTSSPVSVTPKDTKTIDFVLQKAGINESKSTVPASQANGSPVASAPQFFDEPQFTVAGVTQASNSGGHGSDTVLRTTEALAKATVSLSKEPGQSSKEAPAATENSLRNAVAHDPDNCELNWQLGRSLVEKGKAAEAVPYLQRASRLKPGDSDLHHLLGEVDEKLGNPLDAVREYQRAAELSPSEPNLFDWGTELLTHRALQPANEVFAKGNRLYPTSVPMLIALGVSWYALEFYDRASQCLMNASDLAPDNPTPYLFLGRMQGVGTFPTQGVTERLARFAQLHPESAPANYHYAVSLWKQSANESDKDPSAQVESLLRKAVQLDPKLGAAYLKLGILYSRREDFPRAISAYQKAIEVSPELDDVLEESHYRLGQAFQRAGDKTRAQQELELHDHLVLKTKENTARDRKEIQEFVISLRTENSNPQKP